MTYLQYLTTEHWKNLRAEAIRNAGGKCEFCGSTEQLKGHHMIYRRPLTACTSADIMCLCNFHHLIWHKRHPAGCRHERHHVLAYLAAPKAGFLRRMKKKEEKARKKIKQL